jgi:hypothetical protein
MSASGQAAAESAFLVACMTVSRDAKRNRITIYAESGRSSALYQEGDYQIEVIYDRELAALVARVNGAYAQHHNNNVLTFAAAEYQAGRKKLGLRVIEVLAAVSPKLGWYPSDGRPFVPVESILARLRSNDDTMKEYLQDAATLWKWWSEMYGPKAQPDGPANGSQPIRAETNRTSSAAGSRR